MNTHAITLSSPMIVRTSLRDLTMAIESRACSWGHSRPSVGIDSRFSQFCSAHANSGESLWQTKGLPSLRRTETKLRAEKATRRPPQEDWDRTVRDDNNEEEGTSIWDSNAENIRRRRPEKVSYYSRSEVQEALPPSMREGNDRWDFGVTDRSGDSRWDYEAADRSGDSRWDVGMSDRSRRNSRAYDRSSSSSEKSEWDFESESRISDTKPAWQRWFADKTDDVYEEDEDEGYQEEDNWLSWLNVDVKEAFLLLRWGLPAAFLLCTAVIPVMLGNPLLLLFGFTIFPSAVKFLNPLVKDIFSAMENPFASDSSPSPKKRSQSASRYARRGEEKAIYEDFGPPSQPMTSRSYEASQPISRSHDGDMQRQNVSTRGGSLGGWDDLVEDRSRGRAGSQWPLQRRGKSGGKKLAKREKQPLVVRLILAFFPFLRGWAGLL